MAEEKAALEKAEELMEFVGLIDKRYTPAGSLPYGEQRLLESYVTRNEGETYELEQVIRAIPKEQNIKIWRPTVPSAAQDNMPVYWHEGTYSAHTGGWHCDTVMFVEYDD